MWKLRPDNVVLTTAFGKRTRKIRRQALVQFTASSEMFEGVFIISPQIANDAITGCQFLISRRVLRKASQTNNYQESVCKQSSTFPVKPRITPTRMCTAASLKIALFTQIIPGAVSALWQHDVSITVIDSFIR
jgi:hypothetical protein